METEKKVVYTAKVHTTGGRTSGHARSNDGRLDVRLSTPGTQGLGTNPEQLFAAAWSACFEESIQIVARMMNVHLPEDIAVDPEIDLCSIGQSYFIQARLNVSLPGVDRETAQKLVDLGHQNCVYSKAIRGNVDVVINLI